MDAFPGGVDGGDWGLGGRWRRGRREGGFGRGMVARLVQMCR